MNFEAYNTKIQGVKIIKGLRHEDDRGYFETLFKLDDFQKLELPTQWEQENQSFSFQGTLRGLHLQSNNPQGKLIRALMGAVWDVWVDLRPESPTFKKWEFLNLDMARPEAIYLPPGLAHGFFCYTDYAVVCYKCTTPYDKESDGGIFWGDREVGIDWPFPSDFIPTVSGKDANLPTLREYLKRLS